MKLFLVTQSKESYEIEKKLKTQNFETVNGVMWESFLWGRRTHAKKKNLELIPNYPKGNVS